MQEWIGNVTLAARSLRTREGWVSPQCMFWVWVIGVSSVLLLHKGIVPLSTTALIYSLLCISVAVPIIWLAFHQLYLRTGKGRKVAVACYGHAVRIDDWIYTRKQLDAFFRDGAFKEQISLRLVPKRMIDSEQAAKNACTRYNFSAYLRVTISRRADGGPGPAFDLRLHGVRPSGIDEKFVQATQRHVISLARDPGPVTSAAQMLEWTASNLFDMLLMLLSVLDYCDNRFRNAERMLTILDERTEGWCGPADYPRRAIRWLNMRCQTAPSSFKSTAIPQPDVLDQAVAACRRALRYGNEFPEVLNTLARDIFFVGGDLQEALALEERALDVSTEAPTTARALLGKGALNLLMSQFDSARSTYDRFCHGDNRKYFDWDDLVGFADLARDLGYEHAVYMQGFYRRIRGDVRIDKELSSEIDKWIVADRSRAGLGNLYRQEKNRAAMEAAKTKKIEASRKGPRSGKKRKRH